MYTTTLSAKELLQHVENPEWILFDVRHDLLQPLAGFEAWRQGHLPRAHFLPLDTFLSGDKNGSNGRHPLPERDVLANGLAALGVNRHSQVVVYDAHGGMFAARLWWLLRWLGHSAVAVLDGGLQAWVAQGGSLTTALSETPVPGNFRAKDALVSTVTADQLLETLGSNARLVVDARSPDRFRGENETLDPVGGHIPGAINRFFKDNLDAEGTFKAATRLRQEWSALLAGRPMETVTMQCGSGVTACHNLLALELAGLGGASLYPGSWSEWCSDPRRPMALQ